MENVNRAAAIRKCLDKLDAMDEAMFDADVEFDSEEFLQKVIKKARQGKDHILDIFSDVLEDELNAALADEEQEAKPIRNPRRRR